MAADDLSDDGSSSDEHEDAETQFWEREGLGMNDVQIQNSTKDVLADSCTALLESDKVSEQIAELEFLLADHKKMITQQQAEIRELREADSENSQLRVQAHELARLNGTLKEEVARVSAQRDAEKSAAANASWEQEERFQRLDAELLEAVTTFRQSAAQLACKEKDLQMMQAELETFSSQMNVDRFSRDEHAADRDTGLLAIVERLTATVSRLEVDLTTVRTSAAQKEESVKIMQSEFNSTRHVLARELESKNEQLSAQEQNSAEALVKLKTSYEKMLTEAQHSQHQIEAQVVDARSKLLQASGKINTLQEESASLRQQIATADDNCRDLESKLLHAMKLLDEQTAAMECATKIAETAGASRDGLCKMEEDLKASREEAAALKSQLASAEEETERVRLDTGAQSPAAVNVLKEGDAETGDSTFADEALGLEEAIANIYTTLNLSDLNETARIAFGELLQAKQALAGLRERMRTRLSMVESAVEQLAADREKFAIANRRMQRELVAHHDLRMEAQWLRGENDRIHRRLARLLDSRHKDSHGHRDERGYMDGNAGPLSLSGSHWSDGHSAGDDVSSSSWWGASERSEMGVGVMKQGDLLVAASPTAMYASAGGHERKGRKEETDSKNDEPPLFDDEYFMELLEESNPQMKEGCTIITI